MYNIPVVGSDEDAPDIYQHEGREAKEKGAGEKDKEQDLAVPGSQSGRRASRMAFSDRMSSLSR